MLTAARRRARRVRRTAPDAGITLTELIVTATLMSIVGAITLTFFVGSSRATGDTTDANLATASARTTVNAWTALLQVAVSPDPQQPDARNLSLTSTALSFSAALQNRNTGCSGAGACSTNSTTVVTLGTRSATVDGQQVTQLVQTLTTATGSTTTVPVRADVALVSGASCLFTARDIQGTDLGCALTPATSAAVARIDLAFLITPRGGRTQTFRTSVALPGELLVIARARRRVRGDEAEGGFALLFVLFVTVVVLLGTGTMLMVTAGNIAPAKKSQDDYAALAAAQSGIQDYLANLNANCGGGSVQTCSWLTSAALTGKPTPDSEQSWSVRAQNPTNYVSGNDGTVRVTSTGYVGGVTNPRSTKTLVADISSKPNLLRFAYFTNYETLSKSFVDTYYPARTITLTDADVAAAVGLPTGSTVSWQGTATAPQNGYTDDICNALHYAAASNPAAVAGGRGAARQVRALLPRGADFSEDGTTRAKTVLGYAAPVGWTRFAPCQATFTRGMVFNGPVYSRDAVTISNGEWGKSDGPSFTVSTLEPLAAVSTGWSTQSSPQVADASKPYLVDGDLGGTPTTTSTDARQLVQTYPQTLSLPSAATPSGNRVCTYAGPTRVVLSGTSAYVFGTAAATTPAGCYVADAATGAYKVAVTSTTIQVKTGATPATSNLRFPAIADTTPAPTPALNLGADNDITSYSTSADDLYVEGTLTAGKLSLVAGNDIVVTGDLLATSAAPTLNGYGEKSWTSGAAVDLVATNNVRMYHPVFCKSGRASAGYCPNDAGGLFAPSSVTSASLSPSQVGTIVTDTGTLRATHPAKQYCNVAGGLNDCAADPPAATRTVQAAVIALNGSFYTDNFNRGSALGTLQVTGGVYQNHRGPAGQQWQIPTTTSTRQYSGYKLSIDYLSYTGAGLPYVPVLDQIGTAQKAWYVLNVSSG